MVVWQKCWCALLTAGAAVAVVLAGPEALSEGQGSRYDVKPAIQGMVFSSDPSLEASSDQQASVVFRHIEGIDPAPMPLTSEEVRRELGDPFGMLLTGAEGALPGNLDDSLALIDSLPSGPGRLSVQRVFIVSEAGQIAVSEAPSLTRRARAVIERKNPRASTVVFVAPSMRTDGKGILEVMGWDANKGVFNFYERVFAEGDAVLWIWRGDSSHAWLTPARDHSCFRCHRSGEPVMKELRQPWPNWHSQDASIKPESIPDDSPLRTHPLFAISPENRFLTKARKLEEAVRRWISDVNRTRIARYRSGQNSARALLEPLFRTTTLNLKASIDTSAGSGGQVRVPWTFFFNSAGLIDNVRLECETTSAFGQIVPSLERTAYGQALAALDFRLEDPGKFEKRPGDTHFAFQTPETPFTDTDLVFQLINDGIVSRRLAAALMLVDVPNPVYSQLREKLFQLVPAWTTDDVAAGDLETRLVGLFRSHHDAGEQPPLTAAGLNQFMKQWNAGAAGWQENACETLESYLQSVGAKWQSAEILPYFKLFGARREAFAASDHANLDESELLFAKSTTHPSLVMHPDGRVAPR